MTDISVTDDMAELVSAEDFLEYFGIETEPKIVNVNRLHILQRFHDYIDQHQQDMPADDAEQALFAFYKNWLAQAYQDFVDSDAATEKVFKVFHDKQSQTTFVPVDQILES